MVKIVVDRMVRVDDELLKELRKRYPVWRDLSNKALVSVALKTLLMERSDGGKGGR